MPDGGHSGQQQKHGLGMHANEAIRHESRNDVLGEPIVLLMVVPSSSRPPTCGEIVPFTCNLAHLAKNTSGRAVFCPIWWNRKG